MKTNLQSIFNNLSITLFVARRDIGSVRDRVEGLELEEETFDKLYQIESAIQDAIGTLKECQQEVPNDQLIKYA